MSNYYEGVVQLNSSRFLKNTDTRKINGSSSLPYCHIKRTDYSIRNSSFSYDHSSRADYVLPTTLKMNNHCTRGLVILITFHMAFVVNLFLKFVSKNLQSERYHLPHKLSLKQYKYDFVWTKILLNYNLTLVFILIKLNLFIEQEKTVIDTKVVKTGIK